MQPLADGIGTNTGDFLDGQVNNASVWRMQGFQVNFAAGYTHLLGQHLGLLDKVTFASLAIIAYVYHDVGFATKLARSHATQQMLQRCQRLSATADQQPIETIRGDLDLADVVHLGNRHFTRQVHHLQEVFSQFVQTAVRMLQTRHSHMRLPAPEQSQEARAAGIENVDTDVISLCPQLSECALDCLFDGRPCCFDLMFHRCFLLGLPWSGVPPPRDPQLGPIHICG